MHKNDSLSIPDVILDMTYFTLPDVMHVTAHLALPVVMPVMTHLALADVMHDTTHFALLVVMPLSLASGSVVQQVSVFSETEHGLA